MGAAALMAHRLGHHLPGLEVAGGASGDRQHHAAAHIGHHRRELAEGVVPHPLKVAIAHQGGFNPGDGVAQFREGKGLTVIQPLTIGSCHGDGGRLVQALVQQQGQQRWQHPGVVLMEAVAETGEHRGHVFGGLDELPLHVVNTGGDLDVRGQLIHQLSPQHGRQGIGMAEIGGEAVEGVAQSPMAMEAGEEGELGLLFAQHIGAVADRVMAEGSRQAGQHHLLPMELLAQAAGFLEVFFDVIAVGAEHHKLAALDQIAQGVGNQLTSDALAAHVEHGLHVLIVHRCNRLLGEGS